MFTASTTGFLDFLSISQTLESESTRPWRTSVINTITSAVSIAISACSLICESIISLLSGSIPPVSISVKFIFSQVQSAYILSLVTPGVSLTIEIGSPAMALNNVDFPTFGLPIMATTGLLIFNSFFICLIGIFFYLVIRYYGIYKVIA